MAKTTEQGEDLAARAVIEEMVSEGIVQRRDGVLVFGHDREWMIEVKAFEVTEPGDSHE